ncbi:MAG TPA: ice-binding family protein, partial [bacterium]
MEKRKIFFELIPQRISEKTSLGAGPRAALLVLGILLSSLWLFPAQASAQTSTPTDTPTNTPSNTPTNSPTITATSTPTMTSTPQPAQGPVPLGSAASYAVLAGTTVTNTGSTTLCGDLGLSPGTAVTGGPVLSCGGIMHITDSSAAAAQVDLIAAYNDAAGRVGVTQLPQLGGITLYAGVYNSATGFLISTGDLTLDAQGNPNAVFIFQAGSGLTVATSRKVILIGGAKASNIFWQVGSSATINAGADFKGTILALTDINFFTGATFSGQALAR